MGILSDASWIVGEYLLGLHNFILRLLFLDLLPTFMIRNRETTLGSIREKKYKSYEEMYGRNMEERARRNVYERVCEERKLADRMWSSSEMCDHRTVSIIIKNFVVWKLMVPERHERQIYIYI